MTKDDVRIKLDVNGQPDVELAFQDPKKERWTVLAFFEEHEGLRLGACFTLLACSCRRAHQIARRHAIKLCKAADKCLTVIVAHENEVRMGFTRVINDED